MTGRGGGGGGGGGGIRDKAGGGLKTFFRASVWSKNKGGLAPPLDLPLK